LKLGLQIPDFTWSSGPTQIGPTLANIAQTADDVGFEFITVMDHFWQIGMIGPPEHEMLECYSTLAFLAAHSKRANLLGMVTGNPYRYPGVLAKTVTTLDVVSGGRAWLGIGAGWNEAEARGLGIPFPSMKDRFEMLEETLQICLRMWNGEHGDDGSFDGKHYQLARLLNSPQSIQRPHPPILIGGSGEQKTLRLVARYADACNLFPSPEMPRKLEVLRQRCDEEGRDYNSILKTCLFQLDVGEDGSKTGELVDTLRGLAELGIQAVIGSVAQVDRITPLEAIGRDVIPAIRAL
jgi:F420-dependent oxidoreductase-like protein